MALRLLGQLAVLLCLGLLATDSRAATCFAVDDDSARIVVFNRDAPATIRFVAPIIDGVTGNQLAVELIESAYFDSVQNRYYVVVQNAQNRLGYIDAFTGTFIQTAPNMGTATVPATKAVGAGNGVDGIRGLTRNPVTGRWYVIDANGYLFEVNPTTGQYVPGSFSGLDYIRVAGPTGNVYTNVEDLAFDITGKLFVVRNAAAAEQLLVDINMITGRATSVLNIGISEAEGLALTDGTMRLIIGASGGANSRNFYALDTATGGTSLIFNLPSVSTTVADYEAQGCNDSAPRADLALTKSVTPAAVAPGGTLSYTIVLENQGIDPAYRVQVTDVLDAGMSFVSATQGVSCTVCSFDQTSATVGVWTVDQLDIGQRRTLTLVVSTAGVTPNTAVVNRAQVTQSCDSATGGCTTLADTDSTINNKSGAWTPTEDDEAVATAIVTTQPSVNKTFLPATGLAGVTTTLVITFGNANTSTAATLLSTFTDSYPAGLVNAATPAVATSCASGVAAATAGLGTVTLAAGAIIPAAGFCTLSVVVTASSVGVYTNTLAAGALTVTVASVTLANPVGATAQYQVTPANINVIKDFTPDAIRVNGTSTIKITFSNPTSVTATFTAGFTDNYPSGLVNATTSSPLTSCLGSGGPTATAGGSSVSLPSTRAIPPAGSCTITVVVTSATLGSYTNAIPTGSVTTSAGFNLGTASASLLVANPSVAKSFSPTSVNTGGTSTLILTFSNPLSTSATFTSTFTDIYPAGIVNYTTPAVATTCASGTAGATASRNTVTLATGAIIPPLSSCVLQVVVRGTPSASITGTFVNTVPAGSLSTSLGSSTVAAQATLTIATLNDLQVTKLASVPSVTPGQTFTYTVRVVNRGPAVASSLTFTDSLFGVQITRTVVVSTAGATLTQMITTTTSINATATISVNGTMTFTFVSKATSTNGLITNTAAAWPRTGATDPSPGNNIATVALYVSPTAALTVAKTNGVTTVNAGGSTSYTLTFVNLGPSDASGAVVRDPAASNLSCSAVTCSPAGGASCGSLTLGALQGGHPLPSFPAASTVTVTLACQNNATGL